MSMFVNNDFLDAKIEATVRARTIELEAQIEHFKLISSDHSRAMDAESDALAKLKVAVAGLEKAIKQYDELCYDEDICFETLVSTLEKIKAK